MVLGARGVAEFLEASAARSPGKVALVAGKARFTYAALDAWASRIAHALRAKGVARGDRVLIFGDNTAEVAASVWGVLKADAAFFVVNAQVKAEKLAYMIDDAGVAATLLVHRGDGSDVASLAQVAAVRWCCLLVF